MKFVGLFFIFSPIVFVILALMFNYNIFEKIDGIDSSNIYETFTASSDKGRDFGVDSRSVIYLDVYESIRSPSDLLFGLGANGKTDTYLQLVNTEDLNSHILKEGRSMTESGMLNMFQWGGIIGVFFYSLIFWRASYLGIYRSNNWFCVMAGVWLSFKYLYSFLDDTLQFNPTTIFFFMTIGLCFNPYIRSMNNSELKKYLQLTLSYKPH